MVINMFVDSSFVTQWEGPESTREKDNVVGAIAAQEFDSHLPTKYRVLTFTEPNRVVDVASFEQACDVLNAFLPQGAATKRGRPNWVAK